MHWTAPLQQNSTNRYNGVWSFLAELKVLKLAVEMCLSIPLRIDRDGGGGVRHSRTTHRSRPAGCEQRDELLA